jgi:S-DNA-T family DNA segregation ATPase FtsK/SpoIIIE
VGVHRRPAGVHWGRLAELLATHQPEAYAEISGEALSALVRGAGVPSVDVKVAGEVRKGVKLTEVRAAAARKEITE